MTCQVPKLAKIELYSINKPRLRLRLGIILDQGTRTTRVTEPHYFYPAGTMSRATLNPTLTSNSFRETGFPNTSLPARATLGTESAQLQRQEPAFEWSFALQ